MNMNDIKKVTIVNVTATIDAATNRVVVTPHNKWCIAVFQNDGTFGTLANVALYGPGDKNFGKYLKVYTHSRAVVLAAELASEYGLKLSSTVEKDLAAAKETVEAEEKERKEKAEFKKAHPELAAMRRLNKAIGDTQKVAEKSTNEKFVKGVASISRVAAAVTGVLEKELEDAMKEAEETAEAEKAA